MGLSQTIAPVADVVSRVDAKLHCDITGDDFDSIVDSLLTVATDACQGDTGRQFITATYVWTFDTFPTEDELDVPCPPLQSVTSIKYIDTAGVQQTLSTDVYDTDLTSAAGRIFLKYDQEWPDIRGDIDGIEITFKAGYGDAATDVPSMLRHAVKMMIKHLYVHPSPVSDRTKTEVPRSVRYLLERFDVRDMTG